MSEMGSKVWADKDTVTERKVTVEHVKPLHVRVAEALGCKLTLMHQTPVELGDFWVCGCHATGQVHGYALEMYCYDTDWSATGPLIEKYKVSLWFVEGMFGEPDEWRCISEKSGCETDGCLHGPTPLTAVCNLFLALKEAGKLAA